MTPTRDCRPWPLSDRRAIWKRLGIDVELDAPMPAWADHPGWVEVPLADRPGHLTVLVADVYALTASTIRELHALTCYDDRPAEWDCEVIGSWGGLAATLPRWDARTIRIELFRYPDRRSD